MNDERCANCQYWNGEECDTSSQFCDRKEDYTNPDGWCYMHLDKEGKSK